MVRPRQDRPVGIGGVDGGHNDDVVDLAAVRCLSVAYMSVAYMSLGNVRTNFIDYPRECELRTACTVDGVDALAGTGLSEQRQDGVQRSEAAHRFLGSHARARHHRPPFEQQAGEVGGALRRVLRLRGR